MRRQASDIAVPGVIRLIGFGNILHGDDGFAQYLLDYYQQHYLSCYPDKHLIESNFVGVAGLNALSLFEASERILVVDVIEHSLTSRRLDWYSPKQLLQINRSSALHHQGLQYLLQAVFATVNTTPTIELLLCAIEKCDAFSMELSPSIDDCLMPAAEMLDKKVQSILESVCRE